MRRRDDGEERRWEGGMKRKGLWEGWGVWKIGI